MPEILVGDFNSPGTPSIPVGETYRQLLAVGFKDADTSSMPNLTCCHPSTLTSTRVELSTRIDLILIRNTNKYENLEPGTISVPGDELSDRILVSSPAGSMLLWPSDHAGVVAFLRIVE
ncbi:MAG: hypothetical protein GF344_13295 [Chitinivibrionales bacterium]|nr:hypothetical protein [Chitinivibrionales bacterium]